MIRKLPRFALFFLLLGLSGLAGAENATRFGDYTLHHNALASASIDPAIARQYGLTRSKFRGLLNVSLIHEIAGTTGKATRARVTASFRNPLGRIQEIRLQEVVEQDAIYYLGQFPIVDGETLHFTVEASLPGQSTPFRAELSQQFFID